MGFVHNDGGRILTIERFEKKEGTKTDMYKTKNQEVVFSSALLALWT
jgi:ssDNA-specific exonuclease RecJ